jgi:thermitase
VSRCAAFALAVLAALVYVGAGTAARADKPGGGDRAPEWDGKTLLVKFANTSDAASAVQGQGDQIQGETTTHTFVVKVRAGAALDARLAAYRASGKVVFAEPNYIARTTALPAPNDGSYASQWALPKINAVDGWSIFPGSYTSTGGVPVAVVDTGIAATHPDLSGRIDTSDGAGCVNATDTCSGGNSSIDDNGHGTHVAGIVGAATNNGVGVAGTAYSSPIIPVKVLNSSGSGTYAAITNGITWAADHGARVISLSLGGTGFSQTLCDAVTSVNSRGVLVVAAAGNNGSSQAFYPAACPGAVGVAATDSNDGSASFSNFGAKDVYVSAPGVNIYSTCVATTSTCNFSAYATLSGTSMATPFVSGLAALLFSQDATRTVAGVKTILRTTADHVGNVTYGADPAGTCTGCWHDWYGYGRINVLRALGGSATAPPAPASLSSVAVNPGTVTGGTGSTGTVTLSAGAPSGGATVTLGSNAAAATIPASVSVPAGQTSATFSITTTAVSSSTSATISASYSSVSKTATLTINPTPVAALSSVTVSPTAVTGGNGSTGTVTLTAAAPSGGATVALSSDTAAAGVPTNVVIAAGQTSATFSITTSTVSSATTATISATYTGTTKAAPLTINAASVAADFTITASPGSVSVPWYSTARYTVTVTSGSATTGAVSLSVSGLPSATTPSFGTNPTSGTSTLSIRPSWNTPHGTYRLTITGSRGGVVHSTQVTLTIS